MDSKIFTIKKKKKDGTIEKLYPRTVATAVYTESGESTEKEIRDLSNKVEEMDNSTVKSINIEDLLEEGRFTCDAPFVIYATGYNSRNKANSRIPLIHRENGIYRFDCKRLIGSDIWYYITEVPNPYGAPFAYQMLGILKKVGSWYILTDLAHNEVETIKEKTADEWKEIVIPLYGSGGGLTQEQEAEIAKIPQIESELGEFVKVIDLGKLPEDGKFFCDTPFILCGTESKIQGDLNGDNYVIPHTRDLGGYRVDCFLHDVTSSSAGYKYYITYSPMLTHTPNEYQIIGYLEILTLDNVKSRLFNFAGNPVEKLDGMDATQWTDTVLPMFNEGIYERMENAEEKLTQIGLQMGEFENLDFEAENIVDAVNKAYNHGGGSWGNARYENGTLFLNGAKVENDKIIL